MIQIPVNQMIQMFQWAVVCLLVLSAVIVVRTKSTAGLRDLAAMIAAILAAVAKLLRARPVQA